MTLNKKEQIPFLPTDERKIALQPSRIRHQD